LIFLGYIVAKATIHKDPEVAVCMEIEDAELQRLKPRDHVRRVYPVVEATASQNQNTKRWLQGLKPRSQGFIFGGDETPPFRFRLFWRMGRPLDADAMKAAAKFEGCISLR
jgi:hypothetical protein